MMKTIVQMIALCFLFLTNLSLQAQQTDKTARLALGYVAPHHMEVTYNKTSHLLFPSAIRYVDLGSDYLIAGKAEDAQNVLRVKAAVRDFPDETNFSVITDDGRFYSFNVCYNEKPKRLNYDLLKMQRGFDKKHACEALFEELGSSSPSLTQLIMESIAKTNKKNIKHIGARSYGIRFLLKGIYVHQGKFYFHTEVQNKSEIPFQMEYMFFKIVDKKTAKRTVQQQKTQTPLRVLRQSEPVAGGSTRRNVYLMSAFTLTKAQQLRIEIYEKEGGRHQVLHVESSDLNRAVPIENLHLKIN